MESKGTTVVASCIHQALTDSHRYTTLTDATMIGVLQVPVAMLTLRESGALRRLSLTPLRRSTFMATALTVHFAVGIIGMLTALH